MNDASKSDAVNPGRNLTDAAGDDTGDSYEVMSSPTSEDDIYEPVIPIVPVKPLTRPLAEDPQGYLIPYPDGNLEGGQSFGQNSTKDKQAEMPDNDTSRPDVISAYEDLWAFKKQCNNTSDPRNSSSHGDPIYDEVETMIPLASIPGAKIIPIEEPPSAYDEIIFNDGRYMIPSRQWDSDSDAFESDFDDDAEAPNYFGRNLEELYVNLENRKLASPEPRTVPFDTVTGERGTLKSAGGVLRGCLPFTKSAKTLKKPSGEENSPLYVDPNSLGEKEPVMPPLSLDLSTEEAARYEIVNKILTSEAAYKENLSQLVQIEQDSRDRKLLEVENLDVIFCSLRSILQCHEMFSIVLEARMNEWTVEGKLGDIICASFSKSTTTMAYIDFVNNFLTAIDTYRDVCKTNSVFSNYIKAKVSSIKPKATLHDLLLKPFERFPEFIILVQDLLEVTPVSHVDRVPLQLALTQLESLAELMNLRRKDSEMKTQLSYLDTQISQLGKPLSSSGRAFIRQDDMIHCLIDGVSVVGTKKLRLVLLSDMLLCLSPVGKKKRLVPGLLNTPKYKFKLKWNVPLSDVEFVEYGSGVSVAAGKNGTTTTYSDQGKYRQATMEIQKHIEDLHHDLAVIGQIAGLASLLRSKHQLLDQQKVEKWYKSVENAITEELKTVNMFWLELSLPTKSGQHNYVFNLTSPTVKEEWQADATNAKLALESRNNPGWYLPEEDITGGLSILRRNMPLLAEFFDLFIFNARSRVEHTITYPAETSNLPSSMVSRGLGHYVWISARGEMQGHVSILRFERNACLPRLVESFNVCPGTVYSMALIPAMNSRADQTADRYHTKYGFPFPTVWLGSHSSRIYIYDAESDDRSRALMELKLRDAPLAMKFAMKKVYVGLANGTLAIFRSNTSGHWNLVQPSILPLGRYPVAVIADVKDKLWCSSGSQIYVVSKKGDRIQRIIAVDSNMKNLVKHVESCGVGVWVSVWKKATIKLYHAETCEMVQEVNVISPLFKMKNDVDSQVQYLSMDKISVTALLFTSGFLWVGTSVGLILLYPLPKMQGVPRVIGRACVAFHAHCGPVRSLLAIPQGAVAEENTNDDVSIGDEDPNEINRKFSMLADSEESVESDEEFYFVDDKTPKKKQLTSSSVKRGPSRLKVTVKGPQVITGNSEDRELSSSANVDLNISKIDDFAKMMETFDGFTPDGKPKDTMGRNVRSFKNQLFVATHAEAHKTNEGRLDLRGEHGTKIPGSNAPSGVGKTVVKLEASNEDGCDEKDTSPAKPSDSSASELSSEKAQRSYPGKALASSENSESTNDTASRVSSVVSDRKNGIQEPQKDTGKQHADENVLLEEKKDLSRVDHVSEDMSLKGLTPKQAKRKRSSKSESENTNTSGRNSPHQVSTNSGSDHQPTSPDDFNSSQEIQSSSSKSSEKSQGNYVTVLPGSLEKSAGEDAKISNDVETEEFVTEPDGLLSKTGKSRGRCLSYLVVSSGEGHVDLRLKVKSKQDLKKDGQSMFLIWRVNSKI